MPHYIHDTCIGCTACLVKCPTEAIVGEQKGMHVIIADKCIDCGVCGNVCPVTCITDQFDHLVPKKKMTDRPRPVVMLENCTGCEYCVDYCPEDVLEMRNAEFGHVKTAHLVGAKKCIGCALCAEICPHDAIHMIEAAECNDMLEEGLINKFYIRNAGAPVEAAASAE